MAVRTLTVEHSAWNDDFFPPLDAALFVKRLAAVSAILLGWIACGSGVAWVLLSIGASRHVAISLGALLPMAVVVVLNIAGVFNRRPAPLRQIAEFRHWIDGPAGQRHGLSRMHIETVTVGENSELHLIVTPNWLAQPPDKRLTDLASWWVVWNYSLNLFRSDVPPRLVVFDGDARPVGGSLDKEVGVVWIEE